jgi:hypothetical protein
VEGPKIRQEGSGGETNDQLRATPQGGTRLRTIMCAASLPAAGE